MGGAAAKQGINAWTVMKIQECYHGDAEEHCTADLAEVCVLSLPSFLD